MIKYHNAKDQEGNVVPIDIAKKGILYYCLSCGKEMIPKQGKVREHHFSHKKEKGVSPDNICSEETYLHEYAKHFIKEMFDSSDEFNVTYKRYNVCNQQQSCLYYRFFLEKSNSADIDLCRQTVQRTFNLKQYYDTCELEEWYCGFKADVKFSSKSNPDRKPLFVEIAVSHPCEQKKLDSGIRIIEIFIPKNTDNLKGLRIVEGKINLTSSDEIVEIRFHNFIREEVLDDTLDLFGFNVYYTDVYNEDTSIRVDNKCSYFGRVPVLHNSVYEIHFPLNYANYDKWCSVEKKDVSKFRTCWLCKHHSYENTEHEHICDTGREVEQPTRAFHCVGFSFDMKKAQIIKEKSDRLFCRSLDLTLPEIG
ncbi:MAG: hypothetical protein J6Y98_01625 [Bacteroidales bacterium]|nr:hypothetical protein [Bacteroidales bacterium]